MDLNELVETDAGLLQDEWSLSRPRFGKENQLEVIGWSGKSKSGNKYYILKCSDCSGDSELFGEGHFRSVKGFLTGGGIPCGCSSAHKWTNKQYEILCERKSKQKNYKFMGFTGEWKGKDTKISLVCEIHGKWDSGTISSFLHSNMGCPPCGRISASSMIRKSDEDMISSFFSSGAFHPDTKFWRSDRLNSQGAKVYWKVHCPVCSKYSETTSNELQRGCVSCDCNNQRQKECYINLIFDGCEVKAIKFGIACNSKRRASQQNSSSVYKIKQHVVYSFSSVEDCKKAENDCKLEIECGILSKIDMPDGYTETTHYSNLDKIIEIYERNGGKKCLECERL